MKENFNIRKLTEKDREARIKLMRYAFETSRNTYDNLVMDKSPIDWYYGAFENEKLIATAGIIPFDIRMRSRDFKMHGVAGVASKPEYRNRGIVREIMIRMFKDMYDNDVPLSVLYPFKHSFYESLGYKVVDDHFAYEFKISDIIFKKTNYYMKEVVRIDDDIRSVYDQAVSNFDYIAKRPEIQYFRRLYKNNYKFICYNENQPVGYITIVFTKVGEETWLKHPEKTMVIQESFWLDQAAKQTIFNFLWSHRDQRKYIAGFFSKNENIIDHLKTPRITSRRVFDNSLLRIIDVKTVLENLEYPRENFSIIFQISDEFCSWNNGFFNLKSNVQKNITVEYSETIKEKVDIKIDIGHLAQLLAGFRTVQELLEFDFISVNDEKIELLQELFPKTNNYLHDFF
ncbi:MAG: GNAT family N-acetyltransferase [Promethearchaeota archaeon]|jgi:predicted acetyltransferase